MSRSRSLPDRQPARAMAVLALYVLAVAAGSGLLQLRFPSALGWLLAAMWATALLVPLAVLAPRDTPDLGEPRDRTPVLKRSPPGQPATPRSADGDGPPRPS